jgi:threonine dehydrogenase-like Zn-dependent dehydrogenase
VLGHEFVGRVVAAGEGVQEFRLGDRLVPGAGISCGRCDWCRAGRTNLCAHYYTLGLQANGGLAEYVSAPAAICRPVPDSVDDDAAAMAQPLAVALHAVRRSGVREGQTCAVIGVGGIGAFTLAGVAARGVARLIAVDVDGYRLETAKRLGAHVTVNASGRDIAQSILDANGGEGVQVAIESSGAPQAPAAALKAVQRGGRVLLVGLQAAPRELDLLSMTVREVDVVTTVAHVCSEDLPESLDLLAGTDLAGIVLDRVIPLDLLVDEGIKPLAHRTARGKIVVNPTAG